MRVILNGEEQEIRDDITVAELLHVAGVSFAVMGPAEQCTGDRTGQLSPQDESDGKDAADKSTVDRGVEEEVHAT